MALTTVTVHGEILDPNGVTPAVGTVQFIILHELRDVVDNIVYSPATYTATLDLNGEFTLVLPATDNADITPINWVYKVWVNTDVWQELLYFQLPFTPGITEFADLPPLDYDPCTGAIAATPITPAESALFVRKAGDTMSGSLIINANLQVAGDANVAGTLTTPFTGVSLDVAQLLAIGLSTSIISGGDITLNVDPTKIDITALTGYIVTYNSGSALSATNPQLTFVSLPAQIGLALTGPLSQIVTWWLVDSSATIVQQATEPTPTQRRTHLVLGATAQFGGTIFADQTLPVIQSQPANQLADLMDALGTFSKTGNMLSANGINLTINKSAGTMFARAFSHVPTYSDPHNVILPAQTPVSARRATATATLPTLETLLDVGNYDPSGLGVITAVPGGANVSTNFRVWAFAVSATSDQLIIQYGQNAYTSLAAAVAAIGTGTYIRNPAFTGGALLGWISVIRTATDLSDSAQAVFTQAPKFAIP